MEKQRAVIVSDDAMLIRKIELELDGLFDCAAAAVPSSGYDVCIIDKRASDATFPFAIYLDREGADLSLPFRIGELRSTILKRAEQPAILFEDQGTVILRGRSIRLTEVEYSLFRAIYEKGADGATREELVRTVWGEGADEGVLNVYVHYLRQKLETDGERVILAKRGLGYFINTKILGGAIC